MKTERFRAVVREGHTGLAVEVPFDPTHRWATPSLRLEPGRHGHRVHGRLNGTAFDSAIVAGAGGYFLLIDSEIARAGGLEVGQEVEVILHPGASTPGKPPAPPRSRRSSTRTA